MSVNHFIYLSKGFLPIALFLSVVHADEGSVVSAPGQGSHVAGPLPDGRSSPPAKKPAPPEFIVKSTTTRQMDVEEAPEMPGLPSVKGTIHVNVQVVEDPGYPEPPPPLPALQVTDPAVQARLREFRAKYQATQFAFVSATVYDHSRTFLRVYPNGESKNVVSGWSNLDFNFFGGFASYQVKGANGEVRKYSLLMGIGNVDTTRTSELLKKHGKAYQIPVHPALPALATKGPIFIADEGSLSDGKVMQIAQDMHALYQVEGARMESAYYARSKAAEERRAYLLAHPPVPEDVTIRFWKRTPTIAPQPQTE